MSAAKSIVGVDVGGTFTDLFLFDAQARSFRTAKVPSQRGDESAGFMQGLDALGKVANLGSIVHGTTVGTNALLERQGRAHRRYHHARFSRRAGDAPARPAAHLGPVGRLSRRSPTAICASRSTNACWPMARSGRRSTRTPCAPRRRRCAGAGAEALAIVFINAYANPANERRALEAARAVWPNEHVSASHRDAAGDPRIRARFDHGAQRLSAAGGGRLSRQARSCAWRPTVLAATFHIVQSNGGVMSTATARRLPVRTALSGPAAGVIAAAAIARAAGYDNVDHRRSRRHFVRRLADRRRQASLAAQTTIDFGLVIRTPMIEITTIGAGGGSIAWVDRGGLLQVGPESAGSVPGPACYGQGNERPTLTDAHVVLGRINAERPIGGKLARLDVEARQARDPRPCRRAAAARCDGRRPRRSCGSPMRAWPARSGWSRSSAAMIPANFAAMPFGGGGALACRRADRGGRPQSGDRAALPRRHLGARLRHRRSAPRPGADRQSRCSTASTRRRLMRAWSATGDAAQERWWRRRASPVERIDVDFRTRHALPRPDPHGRRAAARHADARRHRDQHEAIRASAFETAYASCLRPPLARHPGQDRLAAHGGHRPPAAVRLDRLRARARRVGREGRATGSRPVWFAGAWRETRVWSRLDLPAGAVIEAPAVLEQPDATIFIDPGLRGAGR